MDRSAIILVNGFPGVGKSSVAKELAKILPNASVLDADLLDQASSTVHTRGSPARSMLGIKLRQEIIAALPQPTEDDSNTLNGVSNSQGQILIIVDTLFTSLPTQYTFMNYQQTASHHRIPLMHVILTCSSEVNIQRIKTSSQSGKEGMDEDALVELRMEEEIAHYPSLNDKSQNQLTNGLLGEWELETSVLGPKQLAGMVAEYCLDALRGAGWFIQLNKGK